MASTTGVGEYIRLQVHVSPSFERDNPDDAWYALAVVVGSMVLGLGTVFAVEAYQSYTRPTKSQSHTELTKSLQFDKNNFKKLNINTQDPRIADLPAQRYSLLELDIPDLKKYFVVCNDRGYLSCSGLLYEENHRVVTGFLKEYDFELVAPANRIVTR